MNAGERLLSWLFPPRCPFCGRVEDVSGICGACRRDLPWEAEPETKLSGGLRCAAPLRYENLAREGLLRFKFSGAAGAADVLGGILAESAAECFSGEFDTVTWVPISARRLRTRGYDQSRLLAEAACRRWNASPVSLLRKERDNPAQSGLKSAAQRRANVLGVYAADRADGKRVLLIDDIVTTGATLGECARVLRESGAESVVCAALARTPEEHPEAL